MQVIKPKIDNNEYKFIELDNKLQILVIYDKNTDKSAASMTVNTGFYNDPIHTQGLAHFLEHMLFMGTTKHKQENYFHQFINESGGSTNAFTMEETTTFYFQVLNKYFLEGIDIFSEFFINPLLSPNAIERETNAVNSEHIKNLSSDSARLSSVLKEFVDNNHPYYNFGCGNISTLKKPNIRDELLNFYNKYYSANLMKLVILSNIEINKIEKIVTKIFSKIKNHNATKLVIKGLPFNVPNNQNSECLNLIEIVPVADVEMIDIIWQIPNMDSYYEYKPLSHITHLLNHESDGGLYSYLKYNNFIVSLSAGIFEDDTSCHLYKVSIELTSKGFKYNRKHI